MINHISKKINKNKACPTKSFRRGFALLFSVLVASLLLAIGLSIFNISLKELAISTAARHSITAFYAADSGREQALYNDLKLGLYVFDTTQNDPSEDELEGNVLSSDEGGSNFKFIVTKSWEDPTTKEKIQTVITSTGWNIESGDRVEREIEQIY